MYQYEYEVVCILITLSDKPKILCQKKLIGQMPVHTEILGPCRPCLDFQECRMMQIAVAGILIISATYFPPPEQRSLGVSAQKVPVRFPG